VNVRAAHLGLAGRSDGPDGIALGDCGAPGDRRRAEVDERHRQAVGGLDRDGLPVDRDGAGERDGPGDRRPHGHAGRSADVDAAMLAAEIGVVAELERPQDGPVDGPCPRAAGRHDRECGEHHEQQTLQ
jgi:hypothetical protein